MATFDKDDKKWLKDNLADKNDVKKLDKKFDKLFNYLDKDVSYFKKRTAYHLGVDVSDLSPSTK
jgi:myo-inositol catabolism protein IolC